MGGGSSSQVVGYKYYVGMHMVFCESVDEVLNIAVGEKIISGQNSWLSDYGTKMIYYDLPDLFGGESKEGGIKGTLEIANGKQDQPALPYLKEKISSLISAYRGVLSIVLHQMYVSATNPYLKPWWVQVKRLPAKGWYDAVADINGHANPIHIVYEILNEQGVDIDDASFRNAADILYNEEFGLSFLWKGGNIGDFLQEIMQHIAGVLFINPVTGKMQITLIRKNYDIDTLPVFDENNIKKLKSYKRRTLSETVNQITLTFINTNKKDEKESITVQDIANIQMQGKIVNQDVNYYGIPNFELASRIAQREITQMSALLSTIEIDVDRSGYNLKPGDLFILRWENLGLLNVVYRVVDINYGTITDNTINIKAIEDVYAMPDSSYADAQDSYWIDPVSTPKPVILQKIVEIPYWDIARNSTEADLQYYDIDIGYFGTLASRPTSDAYNYILFTRLGSGDWLTNFQNAEKQPFAASAIVSQQIEYTDTTIYIENICDIEYIEVGNTSYAFIEDEIVRVDAIDEFAGTLTVGRGCLDTVPTKHNAGVVIFFATNNYGLDENQYITGTQIYAKLCTVTGKGTLPIDQATEIGLVFNSRYARPYPPAYLTINGILFPTEVIGDFSLTWRHRNRKTETVELYDDTYPSLSPEPGTEYLYEIRDVQTGNLLNSGTTSLDNVSIFSYDIEFDGEIELKLWSVRDGYKSWQPQKRQFYYYRSEPRVTENNIARNTEDNILRITED